MVLDESKKVFCIGFNKTGTTSLHNLFLSLGLNSAHNHAWTRQTYKKNGRRYIDRWQCHTDGDRADFRILEKWYGEPLFVLNTRRGKDWLSSRVRHHLRHKSVDAYTESAKPFMASPYTEIDKWHQLKVEYEADVRKHFQSKQNFIEIRVPEDRAFAKHMCKALLDSGIIDHIPEIEEPPHKNRSRTQRNKEVVDVYLNYINECYASGKFFDE